MNGWRSAMGRASHCLGASSSKIWSVRSHTLLSRSVAMSAMSLPPVGDASNGAARVALPLQGARAVRYRVDVYTDEHARQRVLEEDVFRGLTASRKSLPPKYFYDRTGSILFERITELPEYYPTRTEAALLEKIAPALVPYFLPDDIVEVGPGSSGKTRLLLNAMNGHGGQLHSVPL